MADATFDGENLLVMLPVGQTEVSATRNLYSAWKEFAKTGTNARYPVAFDTLGGDPTTAAGAVSPFFFLRNDLGWRIRPAAEDANVTILGNLYGRDPALSVVVPPVGAFTVLVNIERDASSVVETAGSGVTEQDKLDIAALVLDEAVGTTRPTGSLGAAINKFLLAETGTETIPIHPVGTVQSGTNTPTAFETDLTGVDNRWKDALLAFNGGTLSGQVKKISAFASGRVTVIGGYTATPQPGDAFTVVNR